jgi:catechol 2,3-dioxygenase-like lactoylglutathione lyase family enzyme
MTIKITGLLHAGLRIPPGDEDVSKASAFYGDLLGLEMDTGRGHIPGIPGFWVNVRPGDRAQQIHIFGSDGQSPRAYSEKQDPTRPHIAFAVEDIEEAKAELTQRNIEFWIFESLVGAASLQIFFEDGFGNMIELQQATD